LPKETTHLLSKTACTVHTMYHSQLIQQVTNIKVAYNDLMSLLEMMRIRLRPKVQTAPSGQLSAKRNHQVAAQTFGYTHSWTVGLSSAFTSMSTQDYYVTGKTRDTFKLPCFC